MTYYWKGNLITELKENEVFVFGSNPEGRHGAGAAKQALKFGAQYGKGRGFSGQTYALVTKNLKKNFLEKETGILYDKTGFKSVTKSQIEQNIKELYNFANNNKHLNFLISYKIEYENNKPKKSLNGYNCIEMAEFFCCEDIPNNIIFHESYKI